MLLITKKSVSIIKVFVLGAILCISVNQATPISQKQVRPRISQVQLNQIVREVMKDRSPEFIKEFFKEMSYIISSLVLGVGTAAITNQDFFNQFWRVAMTESETFMQVFVRWNRGKIIKSISILLLSSVGYYVLFTLIFDYLLAPKDNKKEEIRALAYLLEAAQKQ